MLDSSKGWNWKKGLQEVLAQSIQAGNRVSKDLNMDLVNQDMENFKDEWLIGKPHLKCT